MIEKINEDLEHNLSFIDLGGQEWFETMLSTYLPAFKPSIIIYTIDASKNINKLLDYTLRAKKTVKNAHINPTFPAYEIYVITKTDMIDKGTEEGRQKFNDIEKLLTYNNIMSRFYTSSKQKMGIDKLYDFISIACSQEGYYFKKGSTSNRDGTTISSAKNISNVLIIGEGGSGKSTLVELMQTGKFNSNQGLTTISYSILRPKDNIMI